ncbi:unnamed protein product [Gordionus sp. m RMFG-2023]
MDDIPTISREVNLILTPLQITSHVPTSLNDCTGGILTPHQVTSHVLTSVNDCTGGDLSIVNKRKRWQINQKKKRTRDSEDLQNRTFSYLSNKQRKKWRFNNRLTRSRATGGQDNKAL